MRSNTCAYLESIGFEVTYLAPDSNGIIEVEAVLQAFKPNTILISIHHVNNELGVIQPIENIGCLSF
ncbi:aminotransferase class V-fold PLP-dependent enzyme [Vibrio vulnificus]|uniref:aminotransferase class V-fold PLP-dependent enzyme n=1 Tax=Vibrio vulnificus TaxID=672 RepID=UPI00298F802C|nr:aminotransferase class V-fold PLP-dependent enzyme [Vibrio vulnificus]